jgi:hypothetical protein
MNKKDTRAGKIQEQERHKNKKMQEQKDILTRKD